MGQKEEKKEKLSQKKLLLVFQKRLGRKLGEKKIQGGKRPCCKRILLPVGTWTKLSQRVETVWTGETCSFLPIS